VITVGERQQPVDMAAAPTAGKPLDQASIVQRSRRIAYWTGWLSPEMEGCSKEVFALNEHFSRSHVFGLSRYYTIKASRRERYFGLNVRLYPLFRAMAPLLERASDINHIYGGLREWFFLRAIRRRPTILTIATAAWPPFDMDMYRRIDRFVTHSARTTRTMIQWGFDPAKITQVYPGVDLQRFRPGPRGSAVPGVNRQSDPARFRVVYATAPNWADGVKLRGVDLMIEAARRLREIDFYLLWRPWPGAERLLRPLMDQKPANVHIHIGTVSDMTAAYQSADATIAPFLEEGEMKVCPTSLIESLACGRPLLVSTKVGISDVVRDEQCGIVFAPAPDPLCEGIVRLRKNHVQFASKARACAEKHFDQADCFVAHERLYEEVLGSC